MASSKFRPGDKVVINEPQQGDANRPNTMAVVDHPAEWGVRDGYVPVLTLPPSKRTREIQMQVMGYVPACYDTVEERWLMPVPESRHPDHLMLLDRVEARR